MSRLYIPFIFFILMACHWDNDKKLMAQQTGKLNLFQKESDIPAPAGYTRVELVAHSFGEWLRNVRLKKDNRVYLYNGSLKANQSAQYAVLDITIGTKDLQQCADAILRLRAEYFFDQNQVSQIIFKATDGTVLSFTDWLKGTRYRLAGNRLVAYKQSSSDTDLRGSLESFLETVFSFCGTLSLSHEMHSKNILGINPGDVFVKGGSPGHAMIVMDVAVNSAGKKVFMLAQSYMPAQDIHIVKNPLNEKLSPWYEADSLSAIVTPEWTFRNDQLKKW
ncbi:MAG: DUF4846 domain-containing protein [Bacteroidota bacterium]|nr:DUF4846 domain-containing protein [Bacteroidota bacterium]